MNFNEIGKAGIMGGAVAIVLEIVVGAIALSIAYDFGFIAMLLGGAVAGWMIKGKQEYAVVAGVVAGLIYVIIGIYLLFSVFTSYHPNAVAALVVGIVLGVVGGFVGQYLATHQGSTRPSGKK